eukprot:TRINITY_DN4273_c0_g1_i2.p1 TRINITY_DN4273_c0_g1~~TRINITY_DN4273_c0_g1_i2.p1  ORF type:complete len:443 (-),score=91.41 TRINITY_DN4273_c0_g1_i2:107-1435(-)
MKKLLNDIKMSCSIWPQRLFDHMTRRKSSPDDTANAEAIMDLLRADKKSTNFVVISHISFMHSVLRSIYFTSEVELELLTMVLNEIENQIKDSERENLIRELLHEFNTAMLEKYDRSRRVFSNRNAYYENLVRDVSTFIPFIVDASIMYYGLHKGKFFKKQTGPLRENLTMAFSSMVFTDTNFAKSTLKIFRRKLEEEEKKLSSTMLRWQEKSIHDFELHPMFMLNKVTLEHLQMEQRTQGTPFLIESPPTSHEKNEEARAQFKKMQTKSTVSLSPSNNPGGGALMEDDGYSSSNTEGLRSLETAEKKRSPIELCLENPYELAIQRLKAIETVFEPAEKVKVIRDFIGEIEECVRTFMNHVGYKGTYTLDAESLFSIICYCVCKSNLQHIYSEIKFMTTFLSNSVMKSSIGYYLTSLEAAASFLIESQTPTPPRSVEHKPAE